MTPATYLIINLLTLFINIVLALRAQFKEDNILSEVHHTKQLMSRDNIELSNRINHLKKYNNLRTEEDDMDLAMLTLVDTKYNGWTPAVSAIRRDLDANQGKLVANLIKKAQKYDELTKFPTPPQPPPPRNRM